MRFSVLAILVANAAHAGVEVQWKGKWYPADLIKKDGAKYCIHYTNFEKKWDECVPAERIRGLEAEPTGASSSKAPRFPCPTDKPQKIFGHTMNPVAVLEKDDEWTPNNVYVVYGPFSVKKTLTIQAGTVVCVTYAQYPVGASPNPPPGSITVDENGTLKVLGTADKHVVFTSLNGKSEYWGGFHFASGSRSDLSTMQHTDVYQAGISSGLPALGTFPDYKAPPLDLQHVTFYSLQRKGLQNQTSGFTPQTRIVVHSYTDEEPKRYWFGGYPVLLVHPWGAHTVTEQTLKIGDLPRAVRYVQLDHAADMNIDEHDVVLSKLDADLAWRNIGGMKMNGYIDDPPTLRLKPGAKLAMSPLGAIYIGNGGGGLANVEAVGTREQPILFTSDAFVRGEEAQAGDWSTIQFVPGNFCPSAPKGCKGKTSRFEFVVFEYGGGPGKDTVYNCNDGRNDRTAAITFTNSSYGTDYEGPVIRNSVWRSSASAGVRARCNVGRSGGCLLTNYEDPKHGNTFEGFEASADRPATTPLGCPPN